MYCCSWNRMEQANNGGGCSPRDCSTLRSRVGSSMTSLHRYASRRNTSGHKPGAVMRLAKCISFSCRSLVSLFTCNYRKCISVWMWSAMTSPKCNYETQFVTRVRKNEAIYGADSVALDCHRVSTLAFSKHKSPISCSIYTQDIRDQTEVGEDLVLRSLA